jgi:hypothetical protein
LTEAPRPDGARCRAFAAFERTPSERFTKYAIICASLRMMGETAIIIAMYAAASAPPTASWASGGLTISVPRKANPPHGVQTMMSERAALRNSGRLSMPVARPTCHKDATQ